MNKSPSHCFGAARLITVSAVILTSACPAYSEDLLFGRVQKSDGAGNMQLIQRSNFLRPGLSIQQGAFILNIQQEGTTSSSLTTRNPGFLDASLAPTFTFRSSGPPMDRPRFVLDGRAIELDQPHQRLPGQIDGFSISPSSASNRNQLNAQPAGITETTLSGGLSEYIQTSRSIPLKGVFDDGVLVIGDEKISIPHDQPISFGVKRLPTVNGIGGVMGPTFTINDQIFELKGKDKKSSGFWINDREVARNPAGQLDLAEFAKSVTSKLAPWATNGTSTASILETRRPQPSLTIDGQELIEGKLLPWQSKPSFTIDGDSLLSGKLLRATSPLLASEDACNPTNRSAYRAVDGKLSATLDPSALPSRKLLSWDEWYEQVAELVRTPLIEAMNKAHNPKGTNTIKITVTREHRITIQMKSPGNPEFDSAVIAAYESLQGNVELEFPDGSMRSKVTFLTDHKHKEDDHCIDVDVISLKGDIEER